MSGRAGASGGTDSPSAGLRAFYALSVTGEGLRALAGARDALEECAARSGPRARFLRDEALHVTLCFLGQITRETLPSFMRVLGERAHAPTFAARFSGLGAFPSAEHARVLVAELEDRDQRLAALAEGLSCACEPLGIAREERPFRPHVTLARLERPGNVRDWLDRVQFPPAVIEFREAGLYHSLPGPSGSRYELLAREGFTRP